MKETPQAPFDITDGRNRYQPCPGCQSEIEMGLFIRRGRLAVECILCGFRGPEIENTNPSARNDKAAFDGWNNLPRPVVKPDPVLSQHESSSHVRDIQQSGRKLRS